MNTRPRYKRFWFLLGLSLLVHFLALAPSWQQPALRDGLPRELATEYSDPTAPPTNAYPAYNAALHLDRAVLRLQAGRSELSNRTIAE